VASLTRALVARHATGRADVYDAALLDVAQDHLLFLLAQAANFGDGRLVFKGGTSLRKCRLGNAGRFSTDLDFSAPDDDVVLEVCGLIDGARVGGFEFGIVSTRGDGRHWGLTVSHAELGEPGLQPVSNSRGAHWLYRRSRSLSCRCRSIGPTAFPCPHCQWSLKRKLAQKNLRDTVASLSHEISTT
jgi:Nucleotidyl transferase AbiEii toxin, Type IV TA system